MKYIIIDVDSKTKRAEPSGRLMFESNAQIEYVISNNDIKLYVDNYFFTVEDITELIAFLAATREYLITKQS